MKCQEIMNANMKMPQRKAMAIHTSSTFSIGSFHQIRCSGGLTDIVISVSSMSLGERNGGDLHDAPEDVQHGRDGHPEEQQKERVVENALHRRHPGVGCGGLQWMEVVRRHGVRLPAGACKNGGM